MATTTDPFASPTFGKVGLSPTPDPYAPWTPTSSIGVGGLSPSLADMAVQAERIVRSSQFTLPDIKPPSRATPLYSPSTKELFVNGLRFSEDDATAALQSEQYLSAPPRPAPAGDWVPLSESAYQQYLQNIRQPGLGRLASRSFGRGVDVAQMLAGRGLQLAGAEELGGRIVEQQMEDLRKTAPYERQFTDVRSGGDLVEWLVANAAQQGPNIVESLVTAGLGFLGGTAASGTPLGGAAASLASVIGKETWKNSVKAALAKRVRGEALDAAETKVLRNAAAIGGAAAASLASGYAQGAADIYGEFREQGAGADDVRARLASLVGGIPYAALDIVPEAVLAARLMGRAGARPALSTLPTGRAKAGEILKRGATGAAVGGTLEGLGELGQEALLLSLTDQELGSPENVKRLINSFAAGAAIGGPIGAGANILNPTNLLEPGAATGPVSTNQPVTPTAPVLPTNAPVGTQGELFPPAPGEMAGPAFSPLPPLPTPGVVPPQPGQMALFAPSAPSVAARMERGIMPAGPGAQGELALTGGAVAPGYVPPAPAAPQAPAPTGLTPEEAAAQGALQFAPPAPEGRPAGPMANQLQAIQDRLRRERELADVQAQQAAQREAELDELQRTGRIGRDLFDATVPGTSVSPVEGLPPMVRGVARTPQQLPLFTRRQAPVPPKAGQLRRGGRMQPPAPAPAAPAGPAAGQLELDFTGAEPAPTPGAARLRKRGPAVPAEQRQAVESLAALRKQRMAFGGKLKAQKQDADRLRGFRNLPLSRAVAAGDVAKVLDILSKSKNAVVSWVAEQAKKINGLNIAVLPDAAEFRAGKLQLDLQNAKISLAILGRLREVSAQIGDQATIPASQLDATVEIDGTPERASPVFGKAQVTKQEVEALLAEYEALVGGREEFLRSVIRWAERPVAVAGTYNPDTKTVAVSSEYDAREENLIAHELGHAVSVEALKNPTAAQREPVRKLRALFDAVKGTPEISEQYGVTSLEEFVAEGWSNPEFQFQLSRIPYQGSTAWGKFTQFIADLLGLKADNAFMEFIALSEQLTTPPTKPTKPLKPPKPPKPKGAKGEKLKTPAPPPPEEKPTAPKGEAAVPPPAPAPAVTDIADPALAEVPTPDVLYRAAGRRQKYPGTFWSAIKDYVTRQYLKGTKALRERTDLPKRTLNVTTLAGLPPTSKNAMLADFRAWMSENHPSVAIEDTYLYEVLVNDEADFTYPTEQDNEYLRGKGYDGVFFAQEGGEQVDTWYFIGETETAAQTPPVAVQLSPEDQWNAERLPGDVAYADLPQAAKDKWAASDRSGAAQITIQQELRDELLLMSKAEQLNYALASATAAMEAVNLDQFNEALDVIIEVAYFKPEGFTKEMQDEALSFLSATDEFNNAELTAIQDAFVFIAGGQVLETRTKKSKTGTGEAGAVRPWFAYALQTPGVLQRIAKGGVVFRALTPEEASGFLDRGLIRESNLPDTMLKALGRVRPEAVEQADAEDSAAKDLADEITRLNASTTPLNTAAQNKATGRLKRLWAQVVDADMEDFRDQTGTPLSAYFDSKGNPYTQIVSGLLRVGTEVATEESRAKREALLREAAKPAKAEPKVNTFEAWLNGRNFVDLDGKPITKTLDPGRVKLTVARFLSRLLRKPKVHVFRNQADLKARNPQLHKRAAAERPGDFDTVNAVGYSFGDGEVIIFTDRVRTEAQLRFVLAHETLGHFGLRSLLPEREFNSLMLDLYERSPGIRLAVDRAMAVRGLSKPEAVEEYLSDFAAALDVSFISRVWNAIKGALNKLGIQFGDEAARYLVGQARRYVYSGQRSAVFDTAAVMSRIQAMETGQDPYGTGRFAVAGDLRTDNRLAGAIYSSLGELPTNLPDAWRQLKGKVGDTVSSYDKFVQTVFSLFNFRARENPGLAALERVLSDGRGLAMQIKNALNEQLALVLNRAVVDRAAGLPAIGGITEEQLDQTNTLLYAAQRYANSKLKRLSDLSTTPLFSVDPDTGALVPNEAEINKLFQLGLVSFAQARDGFSYEDTYMGPEGKPVTEKVDVPGIKGLTEDSLVWKGYLRVREAMRDVELQLLRARYLSFIQDRNLAFREIANITTTRKLTGSEEQFFGRMYRKYRDLWTADKKFDADGEVVLNPDSIEKANEFLVAFNTALIAEQKADADPEAKRRNEALAAFFDGPADDIIESIEAFKDRLIRTEDTKFIVQNRIKDILIADVSNSDADLYTKRTLATGYTPVLRRGGFQVRVVATTPNGKPVRLRQDYREQLVYSQTENQSEATQMADMINGTLFTEKTYKVMAFNEETLQYALMDVQLKAVPEAALDAIAAPPDLNLNEFTRGLRQFSITLPPAKLEQVVVALTQQNNRARQRLKRAFTPGADPDAVRAVSEHIEARASTIAKVMMRPQLSELMNLSLQDTQLLWNGDAAKLQGLKAAWDAAEQDPGASAAQRLAAKREHDAYAFMYNTTNPKGGVARGNQYYNEGARAVAFLDSNRDVNESDFGAGRVASSVRAYTSFLQLGGSIATGALNYLGAITNSLPYLATYNEKTAFGGGFGLGRTVAQVQRALSQVGFLKGVRGKIADEDLSTAEFFDKVAAGAALQQRYGLTEGEARFMAREIREGEMIPALTNSLISSARGRMTTGAGQKFTDGWMWTFNATEQAVRRAVGLAAYRMERDRAIAAGMKPEDADIKARDTAVAALRFTLGDYAVMNRPPLWQSGFRSFIYMYKVFPTTTIQLLSRLPRKGQFYMLASLWVLGGLAAFPFAEDLEDILDTIAQGLGLKMASVRVELAQTIDEVFPGMSPYVLRGFANAYFPGNIADRVSVGNFIPGTGILLAGANVGRELTDIAGPAASMLAGVATSSMDLLRAATTERVTMIDVLRESPVTMGRALGDTIAYVQSGAIVDRRGYVVSPEIPTTMLAARLLGFYPSEAAQQYDVIRASKRMTDYQKEVVAGFRTAWIKAKIQGNEAQAQAIVESVNDWNEGARGTALEIRNFLGNANRALREAQRPAGERFLRAAPRAAREELSTIESLLGYTD